MRDCNSVSSVYVHVIDSIYVTLELRVYYICVFVRVSVVFVSLTVEESFNPLYMRNKVWEILIMTYEACQIEKKKKKKTCESLHEKKGI